MKQFAKHLRVNQTDAERLLWRHLRNRQLEGDKFRRQQTIGPYIVDFVCFENKLIVEIDGGQHAVTAAYDRRRTNFLESEGFHVMRFWNNEVLGNTQSVLESIRAECARPLTPTLSHGGERELDTTAAYSLSSCGDILFFPSPTEERGSSTPQKH